MRAFSRLLTLAILIASSASAQGVSPTFPGRTPSTTTAASTDDSLRVSDVLDIKSVNVADLSADGRWLALTVTVRRDGLGIDYSRDGDPTYLRGTPGELLVVDTRNLAQRPVLKGKTIVRSTVWSPDGSRLAFFVVSNEA